MTKKSEKYDVFLSHSSADKPAVEELAGRLLKEDITPWLDTWNLVPGETWQDAIETALQQSKTCAVFIGPSGRGPWQNEEMRAAINRRVTDKKHAFRVIPVLLPGAERGSRSRLPDFLVSTTWVEFRFSLDDSVAFHRLVCGIKGKEPGPGLTVNEELCPYRGLQAFDVCDDRFFFGREALCEWLLNKIRTSICRGQETRFLAVLGPSGSGKSSLARAGLLAALRRGEIKGSDKWPTVICRPGADPIESLGVAMSKATDSAFSLSEVQRFMESSLKDERTLHITTRLALHGSPIEKKLVILVDQFEEVFSLCESEASRKAFFDNLLYAASTSLGQTIVIVTMRTDFYGKCSSYSALAAALSERQILVGAMTQEELRSAIERPAQLVGCEFEGGLVETLLETVGNEPGALPLLQHALLELWKERRGRKLTYEAYNSIGRLEGALERRAEQIYSDLTPEQQKLCRRIFLRLIQPGEGTEDTKRRASFRELLTSTAEQENVEDIVELLSARDARLVTTRGNIGSQNGASLEISHEALIRGWSRLQHWIEEEREDLRTQRMLTDAALEWRNSGCAKDFLYRGARLIKALEWAAANDDEMSEDEREFLQDSNDQYLQDSRLSDTATLDQLEASVKDIWLDTPALEQWLTRARSLLNNLSDYTRQLEKYRGQAETQRTTPSQEAGDAGLEAQHHLDTLAMLVARLEHFQTGMMAAAEHVANVSTNLRRLTIDDAAEEWSRAIAEIADEGVCPSYSGLRIDPQEGLLPIGRDPQSGLWEFAQLLSGVPPRRDAGGRLLLSEDTALVLVLVPGSSFNMGATKPTAEKPLGSPNVDPEAREEEAPVHNVTLAPFFISKYQMTQGQWLRVTGRNPSYWLKRPGSDAGITLLHPVECVSWNESMGALKRMGLTLPTEAQWEYAARAGMSTIWWCGDDDRLLHGAANLLDCWGQEVPPEHHIQVGHFNQPNNFGLHDVAGNVWEWCRDWFGPYTAPVSEKDGERQVEDGRNRMCRGGSYFNTTPFARSAIRYFRSPPEARFTNLGLRPAKAIT